MVAVSLKKKKKKKIFFFFFFYFFFFFFFFFYFFFFFGCFFFFQAEDGIRDRDVTGVQTCALPICCVYLLQVAYRLGRVFDGSNPLMNCASHQCVDGLSISNHESTSVT